MTTISSRILGVLILLSLLSMVLFGIVFSLKNTHEHAMSGMIDCPFMTHEDTLCPMTAFAHLSILRTYYELLIPSVALLVITSLIFYTFIDRHTLLLSLLRARIRHIMRIEKRILYTFSYKLYEKLCSRGVMHSKVYA